MKGFRVVEEEDGAIGVYLEQFPWDWFQSKEEAEDFIDHMARLDRLETRFIAWLKEATEELGLHDELETLMSLQVTINNLVYTLSHPRERKG
jgi:uncharacterized protein YecE (DUF72 family)